MTPSCPPQPYTQRHQTDNQSGYDEISEATRHYYPSSSGQRRWACRTLIPSLTPSFKASLDRRPPRRMCFPKATKHNRSPAQVRLPRLLHRRNQRKQSNMQYSSFHQLAAPVPTLQVYYGLCHRTDVCQCRKVKNSIRIAAMGLVRFMTRTRMPAIRQKSSMESKNGIQKGLQKAG